MATKHNDTDVRDAILTNEFSRQRWDLFHRAIAHAKQSNHASIEDAEAQATETAPSGPLLTIVR
jgi:hypothetical protein